jgi:diacylglycerol kinase (ATP)
MGNGNRKDESPPFRITERLQSIRNAFHGLSAILQSEHNFRIHLVILVLVVIAGLLLGLSALEWVAIALAAGTVMAGECFNTAVERLSDRISSDQDSMIRNLKDISAAGVLILALMSVIVGIFIFLPHIVKLFKL